MRTLDWVVLIGWLVFILLYGLYRGRGSKTVDQYLRAGRSMPWYVIGLSIMATQASAITFISTTGQSYVDGMRFVQFYFGLPAGNGGVVGDRGSDLPSRERVHGVRISGEAFRQQDAGAGERSFFDSARTGGGNCAVCAGGGLAVIVGWPDQCDHGGDGRGW
jgi:hypothetical protein